MSELTDQEIATFLQVVQRSLARLSREVYEAWSDNKVSRMEALNLFMQAVPAILPIPGAFGDMSQASISRLVDDLNGKDLVFKTRGE